MILLVDPSKPFHMTAKNTLRRAAILSDYQEEIEKAYAAFQKVSSPVKEEQRQAGILNDYKEEIEKAYAAFWDTPSSVKEEQQPSNPSLKDISNCVRKAVSDSIPSNVGDDDDIFLIGGGDRSV